MNNRELLRLIEEKYDCYAQRVIRQLRAIRGGLSGDDSGLGNAWEEYKDQIQHEESIFWDMYEEQARGLCTSLVHDLPRAEAQLLWVGSEGYFHSDERSLARDQVALEEVVEALYATVRSIAANAPIQREVDERFSGADCEPAPPPVVTAILRALGRMDPETFQLSSLDYSKLAAPAKRAEEKLLERPFAYEFYHQFRKLLEKGELDLGGRVIQGEVDKRYQRVPGLPRVPDFLIHKPGTKDFHTVIEFKLASNPDGFEADFTKLLHFREILGYQHLVEVIIGSSPAVEDLRNENCNDDEERRDGIIIWVILYDPVEHRACLNPIRRALCPGWAGQQVLEGFE